MMSISPVFLSSDWLETKAGQDIYSSLLQKSAAHNRKLFTFLERPTFDPQTNISDFEYKLFISGRSGVGKTSTVAKLSANPVPTVHSETPGIQTSIVYWPAYVKTIDKTILFKLQIWDCGENALKKFDHVLPACKDKADGVIFTFSFSDKSSFDDLPQQMSRIVSSDDNFCRFIVGTKVDVPQSEVTQTDVEEFEDAWKLPILSVQNTPDHHNHHHGNSMATGGDFGRTELRDIAPLLNYVCDELWKRDQILASNIPVGSLDDSTAVKF